MHLLRAAAITPLLLPLAGCIYFDIGDGGFSRVNRDFHYSYPMNANGHLSVETLNGPIEISRWNQAEIDISGTKHAPTQSLVDAFEISVDHSPGAVSVRAVRPADARGGYGASFAIKVPNGVIIDRATSSNGPIHITDAAGPARLKTSNGAVRVENFQGALDIQTSNGPIELDTVKGALTARTSNGHIRARSVDGAFDAETSNSGIQAIVAHADHEVHAETRNGPIDLDLPSGLTADVRAHTSNSGITIHLAEPANVRLSAHTSNSSVTTDFDARVHGEMGRNQLEATIGNGGPLLDLSTSNGSIRIVRK